MKLSANPKVFSLSLSLSLALSRSLLFVMEAKLFLPTNSTFPVRSLRREIQLQPNRESILAVLSTTRAGNVERETNSKSTVYKDNWFDRIAINHLSQSVQVTTGMRNNKSGFEGLVEAAMVVSKNFNPTEQRQLVIQALHRAFPRPILSLIRALLPQSQLSREYFAAFTTIFFAWLVGPCEVRESEFNGRREKNVVYVKKCRFLEESNCVGMCINLCKMPSQTFIKESLGTPMNMVPNFDDMSCEMIFGQDPPSPTDDPAFNQPCYTLCKDL